jgi:hypothetical protein
LLINHNKIFWSSYLFIFAISGIARYAVSFIMLPKLKEVRKVEKISYEGFLLKFLSLRTFFEAGMVPIFLTKFFSKKK